MKIALAQMEVIPGKPKENIKKILEMVKNAKQEKVDLIAFPEMSVGGYLLGDKWLNDEFCVDLMSYNEDIRKASEGIAIAFGNIFIDKDINTRVGDKNIHPNKDGRTRKYNAVYVFQNGKEVKRAKETKILPPTVQPKTLLPNYRIFDDQRYFLSLEDVAKDFSVQLNELLQPFILEIRGKATPVGFEICEDLWCEDYRKDGKALNPTKMLIENGAKIIVNISASPWTYGKNATRDRKVKFLKSESGDKFVPFFYVNHTGVQNNGKNFVTFDGGSTVYNKNGEPIRFSKAAYEEELMIIDEKDLNGKAIERAKRNKIEQKYHALLAGIRHMKTTIGSNEQPSYVIGLSGGIDSSLVAALLVKAVGKDKIIGVNMPTKYNSQKTKDAAANLAKKLGIKYIVVPIGSLVDTNIELLNNADADKTAKKLSVLNIENVQAKIRGTSILSNLSAKYGSIFTNNGNKIETALGYATLYGDVGGAIAVIGDLTKTEIVEMCKFMNKEIFKEEVIPEILFPDRLWRFSEEKIIPSAELKEKQIDPMKFGYHCALTDAMTDYKKHTPVEILNWFLDGTLDKNLDKYFEGTIENPQGTTLELMKRWNVTNPEEFVKDLEWFDGLVNKNVFKRVQSPPIIITSKSAYGFDIRESVLPSETTREYDQLKEQVLRMKEY